MTEHEERVTGRQLLRGRQGIDSTNWEGMRSNNNNEQHGQHAETVYFDSNDMKTASGLNVEDSVIAHFKKPCSAKASGHANLLQHTAKAGPRSEREPHMHQILLKYRNYLC